MSPLRASALSPLTPRAGDSVCSPGPSPSSATPTKAEPVLQSTPVTVGATSAPAFAAAPHLPSSPLPASARRAVATPSLDLRGASTPVLVRQSRWRRWLLPKLGRLGLIGFIGVTAASRGPQLNTRVEPDPMAAAPQPGESAVSRGNSLRTFVDGEAYEKALLEQIGSARTSIWLNVFEFQGEATAKRVADALLAAKARGVEVRLVVDNHHSSGDFRADGDLASQNAELVRLRAAGVDLRMPRYSQYRVNHRKLMVVDGARAMLMGMNIGANYLLPKSAGWTYHDLGVVVAGPVVQDIAAVFIESYRDAGGGPLALPPRPAPVDGPYADAEMQVVSHRHGSDRNIERELVQRIESAQQNIVLANGFGMTRAIRDALIDARSRGVAVTWLWGAASRDATLMAQQSFGPLEAAGVEVLTYPGPLHMKAYVIDDVVIVGSANLDGFSMRQNDEVVLQIKSKTFAASLRQEVLDPDLKLARATRRRREEPEDARDVLIERVLEPAANRR